MSDQKERDHTVAIIAALVAGDRWLNADAASVYLGMVTPEGKPNRRGFLERIACRPDFPQALGLGTEKKWKKSEVDEWAEEERRSQKRAG